MYVQILEHVGPEHWFRITALNFPLNFGLRLCPKLVDVENTA